MSEPRTDKVYTVRWLSRKEAARYVGRGVTKFMAEVKAGIWPGPDDRGLWDRVALDLESDKRSNVSVINPWRRNRDESRVQRHS